MQSEELLTVAEVAARLRVSDETVRHWLRKEVLRGYNFHGRTGWRIPALEVRKLLDSHSSAADADEHSALTDIR